MKRVKQLTILTAHFNNKNGVACGDCNWSKFTLNRDILAITKSSVNNNITKKYSMMQQKMIKCI